ncbi:hypothetical protein, partial [Coprococcus eutactus]|uniref:hypothetical protein n=1 Tax=Coprococcus eutactus TaxID=33043 RepID=UPI00210DE71B
GILNKIGGWKKYDSNTTAKTKVPLYGVQKTFVRMDEKPEETRKAVSGVSQMHMGNGSRKPC